MNQCISFSWPDRLLFRTHLAKPPRGLKIPVRVEPMLDANGAVQCFQLTSSDIHFVDSARGTGAAMRAAAAAGMPLPGGGGGGGASTAQQLLLPGAGALPSDQAIDQMLAWLA